MTRSFSVASVVSIALLTFVGGAGCGVSAEAEPAGLEPIATSQAALETGFGTWSETWFNGTKTVPLDWSANNPVTGADTCWLTGVYGGLVGPTVGNTAAEAGVWLNKSTNQWQIQINHGTGTGLRVDVACVNRNTNRGQIGWTDGNGSVFQFPSPPNARNVTSSETQCFLQDIQAKGGLIGNFNGTDTGGWLAFNPAINGKPAFWTLAGNDFPQEDPNWGLGLTAICLDIPSTWTGTGGWGQGKGGA
jgi:hypothetical protein